MLLSKGEATPPCGVPRSLGKSFPWPYLPALSIALIRRSTRLSATRWAISVSSFSWSTDPEKIFQVSVHDPLPSTVDFFPHLAHGILRRSPSPISEAGTLEKRLHERFHPLWHRV